MSESFVKIYNKISFWTFIEYLLFESMADWLYIYKKYWNGIYLYEHESLLS